MISQLRNQFNDNVRYWCFEFNALTLLVWRQAEHMAWRKLSDGLVAAVVWLVLGARFRAPVVAAKVVSWKRAVKPMCMHVLVCCQRGVVFFSGRSLSFRRAGLSSLSQWHVRRDQVRRRARPVAQEGKDVQVLQSQSETCATAQGSIITLV